MCNNVGGVGSDEVAWVRHRVGIVGMGAGRDAAAHLWNSRYGGLWRGLGQIRGCILYMLGGGVTWT